MKKIVLGLIALTITVASMAQSLDKNTGNRKAFHKEHRQFRADSTFEKLNLNEEQKSQIETLNQDFRQQMKELNKQGSITVSEQKAKRKQLMKEHREKIEALLTPEQRKQAESMRKDFSGKRGNGEARFEKLTKDLNLTPDQSTKMTALNEDLKKNLQEIKQNSSLSEDEKKQQFKSLMQKHRNEMEALLTAEQKEQLKKNFRQRAEKRAVK